MRSLASIAFLGVLVTASATAASGLGPWKFGMSRDEVKAISQFGPYKSFSNGDLEIHAYEFDRQKRNVQFFFDGRGLNRIEINYYEDREPAQATAAFRDVCEYYRREYGQVEAKFFNEPQNADCMTIAEAATAQVEKTGKVQIAPPHSSSDLRSFSSYRINNVLGTKFYSVVLYLDPSNRDTMPKVPTLLAKPEQQ